VLAQASRVLDRRVLRPATFEDFSAAPVDGYSIGENWLAFYQPHLSGAVVWGTLGPTTMLALAAISPIRLAAPARPHPTYLDLRLVDAIEGDVLTLRDELYRIATTPVLVQQVPKAATLYSPNMVGATIVGIGTISPAPYPEAFFTEPDEALRWLERSDDIALVAELDYLRVQAASMSRLVRELRKLLDEAPRQPLRVVARQLGVSARSLQRQLAAAGTTFEQERALATVRTAQRLLLDRNAHIKQVALEVGCTSPQQLAALFRKFVGETPTEWRARQILGA
jgi:AraC-like DNA-binding protein